MKNGFFPIYSEVELDCEMDKCGEEHALVCAVRVMLALSVDTAVRQRGRNGAMP